MTTAKSPLNDGKPKRRSSSAQTVNKKTKKDDKRSKTNNKLSQGKIFSASKDKTSETAIPKIPADTNSTPTSTTVTTTKTKITITSTDQDVIFADAQEEETGHDTMETNKTNSSIPDASITSFKKVNSRSKNRRQKKQDDTSINTGGTPERQNKTLTKHQYVTRFTLKVNFTAKDDPEASLLAQLKVFFQELKKADEKLQIYIWKEKDSNLRLQDASSIPTTIGHCKPFFDRLYAGKPNQASQAYTSVRLGHDIPLEDLRRDMSSWLRSSKNGLFHKMLQVESASDIGWLLYSTREMDAGALADEISDILGMQIGLSWKVIDMGVRGKIPASQKVMALTVEVSTELKWDSQRKFLRFFGRKPKDTKEYPNGIRLRFVKNKRDALTSPEKSRIDRLRQRQQKFTTSVQRTQTWNITQLDYADPTTNDPTLRQMIMDIKSRHFPEIPLFHCIDLNWQGDGYTIQFCPNMKEEAEVMVNTLLPYLQYKYKEIPTHEFFTDEYVSRCVSLTWDPTKGEATDPDMEGNDYDAEDDVLIGFSIDTSELEKEIEKRPAKDFQAPTPYDDDSVPTLGPRNQSDIPNKTPPTFTPASQVFSPVILACSDTASLTSATSTVTMDTIASITSRLDLLTKQVTNTDSKFSTILNLLQLEKGKEAQPPSDQTHATPDGNADRTGAGETRSGSA